MFSQTKGKCAKIILTKHTTMDGKMKRTNTRNGKEINFDFRVFAEARRRQRCALQNIHFFRFCEVDLGRGAQRKKLLRRKKFPLFPTIECLEEHNEPKPKAEKHQSSKKSRTAGMCNFSRCGSGRRIVPFL